MAACVHAGLEPLELFLFVFICRTPLVFISPLQFASIFTFHLSPLLSLPPSTSSSKPRSRSSANVTPTSHKEMFSILRWLSQQCKMWAKTHNTHTHTHSQAVQVFKSCLQPLTHRDLAEANPANQNTEHWDLAERSCWLRSPTTEPWRHHCVAFRGQQVADYIQQDYKTFVCIYCGKMAI